MSISQSAVANKLRLLRLSLEEQRMIVEAGLTERHGRALLRIDEDSARRELLDKIVAEKLNVSGAEAAVEEYLLRRDLPPTPTERGKKEKENGDRAKEKGLDSTVRSIRKKVDCWVNEGGNAEINVTNRPSSVEIFVKLLKQ